jgi:transcriptional regulator with XRE-family HTH domain
MSTPEERIASRVRIAGRIRRARKHAGISGEEAARRIGVASRTYYRWEKLETFGFESRLDEIAKALGVSYKDLLGGETLPSSDDITKAWSDELAATRREIMDEIRQLREDLEPPH